MLIAGLSRAATKGRLDHAIEPYVQPHVLVIDEVGYLSRFAIVGTRATSRAWSVGDQNALRARGWRRSAHPSSKVHQPGMIRNVNFALANDTASLLPCS